MAATLVVPGELAVIDGAVYQCQPGADRAGWT